jgi:uncharacterized protein (TIGR02996 family)
MNEEDPFLEEIKARPQDLFLRLAYADWLEERGDPRSEYLRVDGEFHQLLGSFTSTQAAAESRARQLRARLKKLGKTLDPAWTGIFDALRPSLFRCRACRKVLSPREAIDTNPRSYRKMKTSRYCKNCYEDVIRSTMHRGSDSFGRRSGAEQDYHGGASYDD